ncbi:MAG: DUF262 domain-containing protein [Bacteroidetes bacterium]|nr:DUF262 domain-containing protein [Bacteroidota bacterium]
MNIDASNRTYRQLMGNGLIYTVPRFQRDYSWTSTEWDDLWKDIEALFEEGGEQEHYMGYLVLQSRDSKNFDVIDGQQRLTTLSILVLTVLGNLQNLIDSGIESSGSSYDFESDVYNIEHIMPESLQEAWDHIGDRDHEQFLYRLGNMTILNKSANREIGNKGFETKREAFAQSEFAITQRIARENNRWDPDRIVAHQKWLARQATAIWRIAQLSN